MELLGEEKKIQALFSQLRLDDERTAPSFAATWSRAQAKTYRPRRAFNLSFVAATALLVCALVSLALWSKRWQQSPAASIASVPGAPTAGPARVLVERPEKNLPVPKNVAAASKSRALKLVARRELAAANRKAAHEAQAIANWQSPTATLLESPSDELLKSLPQLNQTVDELKSFLPSQPK